MPSALPAHAYPHLATLSDDWHALARRVGARMRSGGSSVQGRALWRVDFGCMTEGAPSVLLSSLMHGTEAIGGMALLGAVEAMVSARDPLLAHARVVVLPVVNPDALAANALRVANGRFAAQRCNANGVDLNRNFGRITDAVPWHPFAGSRQRWSPHFMGEGAFSEPETRFVRDVALATRPVLSIGFHSFGNLLLYPWAWTDAPHPEAQTYAALGAAFRAAQPSVPYTVQRAMQFYPTVGDMDDWMDATVGTRAFTVEVSSPRLRDWHPRHWLDPFTWMNPVEVEATVANVIPGVRALMAAALGIQRAVQVPRVDDRAPTRRPALDLAAR